MAFGIGKVFCEVCWAKVDVPKLADFGASSEDLDPLLSFWAVSSQHMLVYKWQAAAVLSPAVIMEFAGCEKDSFVEWLIWLG